MTMPPSTFLARIIMTTAATSRKMNDAREMMPPVTSVPYHCDSGEQCRKGLHELHIPTLEGAMTASPGDWIIRGVQGEFYPCKPDIFAETYEPVEVKS